MNRLVVITKYCHLGAIEGLTLGQYFENVVWGTRGDPRTLSGVYKVKPLFIYILCCFCHFHSSSHWYTVPLSRHCALWCHNSWIWKLIQESSCQIYKLYNNVIFLPNCFCFGKYSGLSLKIYYLCQHVFDILLFLMNEEINILQNILQMTPFYLWQQMFGDIIHPNKAQGLHQIWK